MRVFPRKRTLALVPIACAGIVSCTLLNSLDHLQSRRYADDAWSRPTNEDGSSTADDAGPALPGCGPNDWPSCGVTVVATPREPGGVVFFGNTLFFTDEASGQISKATCSSGRCYDAAVIVSGEEAPRRIAFSVNSLAWTTPTALRRLDPVIPMAEKDASVETIATLNGEADVAGVYPYPYVEWTDATGARACYVPKCEIVKLGDGPARSPTMHDDAFFFVAKDAVQRTDWMGVAYTPTAAVVLPGTSGAVLVVHAPLFSNLPSYGSRVGLVASLRHDGGSNLVIADLVDDAGVPVVLAVKETAVAVIATSTHVYWTTAFGELKSQIKDLSRVTTILHGLSNDTSLAVSDDGLLAIADRGRGEVLTWVRP